MLDKNLTHALNLPAGNDVFLRADWQAPARVRTLISTRAGGVSQGAYAGLNIATHVGDQAEHVAHNRATVQAQIPVPLAYLNQVHGNAVVSAADSLNEPLSADASVNHDGTAACAVMTADCLPVLFCDRAGTVVAAAHAGWRGLAGGVLQNTLAAMNVPAVEIMAWLGPAIGAEAFEVGQDVYDAFCTDDIKAQSAFQPIAQGKYLADIYALARLVLQREGVTQISGGQHCTVLERERFYSYRRDRQTGRMVSAIWLENAPNA